MRLNVLVLFFLAGGACLAQLNHPINHGYGNVVYPGTGHPATINPLTLNSSGYAQQRNIGFAGRGFGNRGFRSTAPLANHPGHSRTTIVPYPIFYGDYDTGGYYGSPYDGSPYGGAPYSGAGPAAPPVVYSNQAPSVVINQSFLPAPPDQNEPAPEAQPENQSGMQLHEGPKTPPYVAPGGQQPAQAAAAPGDQPTLYLIALKDHSIIPALGFWVQSGNLFYVSEEHAINQVSLDLVDRGLSQRLNNERNVPFRLPQAQ